MVELVYMKMYIALDMITRKRWYLDMFNDIEMVCDI